MKRSGFFSKKKFHLRVVIAIVLTNLPFQGSTYSDLNKNIATSHITVSKKINSVPEVEVPANLGRVKEVFIPSDGNSFSHNQPKFVFCIRDAHSNPDAQKQIKEIMRFLTAQYGVAIVGAEGAIGELHPDLLNFFPQYPEANRAVIEDLAAKGELTASDLFAIEYDREMKFHGVENGALYRRNLKNFKEIYRAEKKINKALLPFSQAARELGNIYFNPKLKEFYRLIYDRDREAENISSRLLHLAAWIKKTGLDADGNGRTAETRFPQFFRAYEMVKRKNNFNRGGSVFANASSLEIKPDQLMAEMRAIELAVLNRLAVREEERSVIRLMSDLMVIKKLVDLRWTFEDRKNYGENKKSISAETINRRIRKLSTFPTNTHFAVSRQSVDRLNRWIGKALKFYRDAEKRNAILVANLFRKMDEEGLGSAILVAGGYHTEGISSILRNQNIGFAVIEPRFNAATKDDFYGQVMNGKHADLYPVLSIHTSAISEADLLVLPADYRKLMPENGVSKQFRLLLRSVTESGIERMSKEALSPEDATRAAYQAYQGAILSPAGPVLAEPFAVMLAMPDEFSTGLEIRFSPGNVEKRILQKENIEVHRKRKSSPSDNLIKSLLWEAKVRRTFQKAA